jgi:RNA polymerase sigma factor (sigma-70 family)
MGGPDGSENGVRTASDTQLMCEVRAGRTTALATLFERHHARLYRFCLRMTGDRTAAEDLVQDVFMRMLKYRKTFRGDAIFAPWMFRIARNVCADHLHRTALDTVLDEEADDTPPTAPAADVRAADDERADLIRRALLALPVQGREVLVLSRYEFMTYEEIAGALGCSAGAVKVRAHRAIKQLRRAYLELSEEVSI